MLVIRGYYPSALANALLVCNVAEQSQHSDAHADTLYQFHARMGHLNYDAIEALANKLGSEMVLTDTKRPTCLTAGQMRQLTALVELFAGI